MQLLDQVVGALSPPAAQRRYAVEFECEWCHRKIEVERAGWPYIHSVALLHLHSCPSQPASVTSETIEANAERIADAVDRQFRGE